jgi:hypothetical protein
MVMKTRYRLIQGEDSDVREEDEQGLEKGEVRNHAAQQLVVVVAT